MLETILLHMCIVTCMPALAYLCGDLYHIIKKDFGFSHWFTESKKRGLIIVLYFFAKVAISFLEKEEIKMLNTLIIFGLWVYAISYLADVTER